MPYDSRGDGSSLSIEEHDNEAESFGSRSHDGYSEEVSGGFGSGYCNGYYDGDGFGDGDLAYGDANGSSVPDLIDWLNDED